MEQIVSKSIKSILIGSLVCIVLGYVFSNTTYYYKGNQVYRETKKTVTKEEFNFKVGLISGALTTIFLFLVIYDDEKKNSLLNNSKLAYQDLKSSKIQKPNLGFINSYLTSKGKIGRTEYILKLILLNFIFFLIFEFFSTYLDSGLVSRMVFVSIFGLLSLFIHINLMIQRLNDTNLSLLKVIIYSALVGGIIFPFIEVTNYLTLLYVFYVVLFIGILFLYPSSKSETNN